MADLDGLRALCAVAALGSRAAAARHLQIPLSTLRNRLAGLSAAVGEPVLKSGPGGARLTPVGEVLAEGGAALIASYDELIEGARQAPDEAPG